MDDELFLPDFDVNAAACVTTVGSCSVGDVLLLLRQLYVLSSQPPSLSEAGDHHHLLFPSSPDHHHHHHGHHPPAVIFIPLEEFNSKKVTNKLTQQLSDPLVVAAGALPAWCDQLLTVGPMAVPFETRQTHFQATAFGTSRSIVWLQSQRDTAVERQRNTGAAPRQRDDPQGHEFRVVRLKHERVRVPRGERLLDWAQQVMRVHAERKAILEVEFQDEEGTGLGPSLEFYAFVAAEIQRRDLALWICDDDDATTNANNGGKVDAAGANVTKPPGYYVVRPSGLFPAPLPQDSAICDHAEQLFWFLGTHKSLNIVSFCKSNFQIFFFLFEGVFLAKALQDGRLVDLPLSTPFLKLLCQGEVSCPDAFSAAAGGSNSNNKRSASGRSGSSFNRAGSHPPSQQTNALLVQSSINVADSEDPMTSSIFSQDGDRWQQSHAAR